MLWPHDVKRGLTEKKKKKKNFVTSVVQHSPAETTQKGPKFKVVFLKHSQELAC